MTQEIKDKLAKVYELVNRGATEGERAAAKQALDKLMKKYNLSDEALTSIHLTKYQFKYSSNIEFRILVQIFKMHTTYVHSHITRGVKCLYNQLTYLDYVTAIVCMNITEGTVKCNGISLVKQNWHDAEKPKQKPSEELNCRNIL